MNNKGDKKKPPKQKKENGGLGTRLMTTFAQNVQAEIEVKSTSDGTVFTLSEISQDEAE
jgi:two-component sensor histidine kinase